MTYRNLGNNNYEIKLKLYRDCGNIFNPYDNFAFIGIYNTNKTLVKKLAVPFPGAHRVVQPSPSFCFIPPGICSEEAIYMDTVNLPAITGGYDVVYQLCCRFGGINVKNSAEAGATYYTHITTSNSSPVFNKIPPIFLCLNENVSFDYSATDPDGDKLVYEICTPYDGSSTSAQQPNPPEPPPYKNLTWETGYSLNHPVYANPAFTINSTTGLLTGRPTQEGTHLFAVCVSEYRNGVLLSVTKRDFQFEVVTCQTVSSTPTQQIYCDGLTVNFYNKSENSNQYFWDFGDKNNQNDTSSLFATEYTYADSGTYTVTLIARNTTANCSDTAYNTFTIAPPYSPTIIAPDYFCLLDTSSIYSIDNTHSKNAIINWDFGTHANPQYVMNDTVSNIKFDTSSYFYVSVTVSQNNCTYKAGKIIEVIDTAQVEISSWTQHCVGQSVNFDCSATSVSKYHWDFGINNITTDTSTKAYPTYIYPDTGKYNVTLIGINDYCPADTHSLTFYVYPKLQIHPYPPIQQQCIDGTGFNFEPKGIWDSTAQFHWYFLKGNPDSSVIQNPKGVKFDTIGYQRAYLITTQYGCRNQSMYIVRVNPKPRIDFYANKTNGCTPFTTHFFDTLLIDNPIKNYQWKYENTIDTAESPTHIFYDKNTFDVTLMVEDINGCTNTLTKTNYITTENKPYNDFTIKSNPVSILDPIVSIIDTSRNINTNYYYILPYNEIIHDSITDFRLNDTGTFEILKIVTTNLGCSDTTIKYVRCTAFPTFSMPNVFTPNNDGLNEEFIPKVEYANKINFKIFNRWGELFFETNELNKGWDGKTKHNKTALSGTYFYQIYVEFFDGSIKTESGAFSLIL
jgi:gliding motility-associated-like protein